MFPLKQTPYHQAKILIVDDKIDNLELLSTICNLHGFETFTSDDSESVIELAQAICPNVILLDICMPKMDGYSVCEVLKSNSITKDIPIIFISAFKEVENKTQAFEMGGNDYITKPFEVEDVIARIENQLKFHRIQVELKEKNQELAKEVHERQTAETKLIELNEELSKLATLDSLTNIANRRYLSEILTKEWQIGKREYSPLSFILGDIDYFKFYNDCFGHQAGDICLQQVAKVISKTVNRSGDLAARYGGEEFAIILPQTKVEDALLVAERICQQVKNLNISHPNSLVSDRITMSLGVSSTIPSDKHTEIQLLGSADKALYEAKKQGRDRVVVNSF